MLKQATVQLTPETQRQLDDLRGAGFGKLTNVTREAIARMWRAECQPDAGEPVTTLHVWRHKPTRQHYLIVWRGAFAAAHGPMDCRMAQALCVGALPLPEVADADLGDWAEAAWDRGEMEEIP